MAITWTRMRDGTWGLRFTNGDRRNATRGRDVRVVRADGSSTVERVGSIVARFRDAVLSEVMPRPEPVTGDAPVIRAVPVRSGPPAPTVAALLGYDPDDGPAVAVIEPPAESPPDDGTFSLSQYEDTDPDRDAPPAPEPAAVETPAPVATDAPAVDESAVTAVRPHLFVYDIPDRAEIPNPSGELYGRAVRINLSCWVVAEGDIPWNLLHRLNAAGATAYVVPFDPRGAKTLVTMMTDALRKEIADALRRCDRSARLVEERIAAAADSSLSPDEADEWTRKRAADVAERMGELLSNLETAAARFGIPAAVLNARDALNSANAIGSAMNARAAVYAEAVRVAREARMEIAVAAESDRVPAGVLSDALRDGGHDGAADALNAAFDPNAG